MPQNIKWYKVFEFIDSTIDLPFFSYDLDVFVKFKFII